MKQLFILLIVTTMIIFNACSTNGTVNQNNNYSDWSDQTHSKNADPDYSVVFNQNEVLRFDIKISSENWSTMQTDLADNLGESGQKMPPPAGERPVGGHEGRPAGITGEIPEGSNKGGFPGMVDFDPLMVPCSFNFNGLEWYNVGIRYKGNSSLNSAYSSGNNKLSFKLDFDEFEDEYPELKNQRFYGFKQLNLNSNYNDSSLMREKVGSDLFREFGLISAHTTFCEVYVDFGEGSQYFGLYTLVEEVDDTVIENQFGDDNGNLYKPDGNGASFADGTYNEEEMGKDNNKEDYSDVADLYNIINSTTRTSDTDQWEKDLEAVFNVDGFLKWLAANTVIQNWDTYGRMTHNYYLYNNPETMQLNWIPWDNNESLQNGKMGGALSLSLKEITEQWPLIRYLIDNPLYKEIYNSYLMEFVNNVFTSEVMTDKYSAYYELLKEYAYAEETGYTYIQSDSDFDQAVDSLKNHVQSRNDAVNTYQDN